MRPAPRTDPYLRNYLIRLLPRVHTASRSLTYPGQSTQRFRPVLRPARGRLPRIPLGHRPSLQPVRGRPGRAARSNTGGGLPAPLFRLRGGVTVPPYPDASHAAPLFPAFTGTMPMSDFPPAYASGLRPQAFPDRPTDGLRRRWAGADGISRFSCMELPRMRRVSDSAGPMSRLALTPRIVSPSLPPYEVGAPEGVISELNGWPACSPVNAYNVPLRTRRHDSGPWWVATAFHVRLFHPLLHAGLSRRSSR